MAIVLIQGWEAGLLGHPGWLDNTQGTTPAASGRDGIGVAFVQTSNLGATFRQSFVSGSDTIFIHQGIKLSSASWGTGILAIRADSGVVTHITIVVNVAGRIEIQRGGTILATSTLNFPAPLAWYSMEVKATIHDTTGEVVVKVAGDIWVSFTGDTKNAGTSTRPDVLSWPVNNDNMRLDDLVIFDTTGAVNNSWPGEICIMGIRPDSDGANSDLLGSDGNSVQNFLLVDEFPFNTSDYVGSPTAAQKDIYGFSAVGKTGNVLAVQPVAYVAKSDAGAKAFKHVTRSVGGVNAFSVSTTILSTTFLPYLDAISLLDPDGNPWTVARVDGAQFGMEVQ